MPTGRSNLGVGLLDGQIYAIGGGGDAHAAFASTVVYDRASDKWGAFTPAPMSEERRLLGVGASGGQIYVVGGAVPSDAVATAEVFSPSPVPTPPTATYMCSNGQCTEQAGGVPKATCETLCSGTAQLYQCVAGTCVQQDHGVDKATCEQLC